MTAVRYDPATGATRLASQPGPETLVWSGDRWVPTWVCGSCRKPGVKHPHHPHCTACVGSYILHQEHIQAHIDMVSARKDAAEAALAADLNSTIYVSKPARSTQITVAPAFEVIAGGSSVPGKAEAMRTAVSACKKCGFFGKHDREQCFGRWLSTPHNDPPACFVHAAADLAIEKPKKFKLGEKVYYRELPEDHDLGGVVMVMQVMGPNGRAEPQADYCVVSLDETIRYYVAEDDLRHTTKRDMALLALKK